MALEKNIFVWPKLVKFLPELETKKIPKDREFFFNILNTINPGIVERMVLLSMKKRENKSKRKRKESWNEINKNSPKNKRE